ncbi:MAG: hypothetical protein U5K69_25660 [Balneolaceae bacterium]|nr:hypothetical protein [Balneolaceae bacterium]
MVSTIAYLGYDDKVQTYQVSRIYTMNVDGSGIQQIETDLIAILLILFGMRMATGSTLCMMMKVPQESGTPTVNGNTTEVATNVGGTTIGRPDAGGSLYYL